MGERSERRSGAGGNELKLLMARAGVRPGDVTEKFVRAQGPGGQNVNKVSTCVWLRHQPTGIEVKCQKERSQAQNRIHAWELLLQKIEVAKRKKEGLQRYILEKIRRQKRRRSRSSKDHILEVKHRHAAVKALRARVREEVE
jgi:peptide chain release factor